MDSHDLIFTKINPHYFWDVDLSKLDDVSASRLIIERVFTLGDIPEIQQVIQFYGEIKIVEILSNQPYIDQKSLNFISKLFNKPYEEFRCYQRLLSNPKPWTL